MLDQRRAVQIYLENKDKFSGMSESDAVGLIRRSGGLPATAAPVEAAPATAMPGPAPFQVAPAPEVAPVPEVAPTPTPAPPVMNPYEMALAAYNEQNPVVTPAPAAKGAPVDYVARARQDIANARREELEATAKISRETKIDPEIQELISNRQARYETELSEADKDRKQATWMAVAQAGMKMAQSQSPYFMQALASGMEAGINGFSEAKAKAAEKKARLQDAKEDLVLKAKELRDQAVKDAISARLASKQAAAADSQLLKDALGVEVAGATAGDVVKSAALGNRLTEAQISKIFSDIKNDQQRVAIARSAAGRDRTGGSGGVSTKVINAQAGLIKGQIAANNQELNDITIPRDRKARLQADNDRLRRDLAGLQSLLAGNSGAPSSNPLGLNLPGR